jgi:hypothetical protein
MLLERIESTGIQLETDGEFLDVTGELNDSQRQYIRGQKKTLITALRLRPFAEELGHSLDDLLDWYSDDIEDLFAMSNDDLRFIVRDYVLNHVMEINRRSVSHVVRCIDCNHFERIKHPHLGHCAVGIPESQLGMWDTEQRGCEKFIEKSVLQS